MKSGLKESGTSNLKTASKKILTLSFLAVIIACSPSFASEGQNGRKATEKIEMAAFQSSSEASDYAERLRESGYYTQIEAGITDEQQTTYHVYVLIFKDPAYSLDLSGLPDEIKPVGTRKSSWNLMGMRKKYIHGSLALSGVYTDNVLNSRKNKKADFSTVLSPAIWIAIPGTDQKIAPFSFSLRSPGGYLLSRQWTDSLLRYQASLSYRTDIPLTSSSGNLRYGTSPSHNLSGSLMLRGNRLSLLLEDQYEYSSQEREAGIITRTGEEARYNSNYFGATLVYETGNRLLLSGGYSHFLTRHKIELSEFRNRQDDGFFASLAYKLSPRLNLTAEYRFFDIEYEKAGSPDSNEHYFLAGLSWAVTAKTKGMLKAGYGIKDLDGISDSYKDFSLETQLDYRFSPKTMMAASAYRKTTETNLSEMTFSVTTGGDLRLQHLLTSKITTTLGFLFANDQYKDMKIEDSVETNTYQWTVGMQYAFRNWLRGNLGYAHTRKDASVQELEYNSNTLFFSIMTSL